MTHCCETLVNEVDFDPANDIPCSQPASVKHGGFWFCEFHYDVFFAEGDTL
jgi:hypothetical protein